MASYKLNVFHWHLTDDQGWRVEIKAYPELTKAAAWRNSTQKHRDKTQDYLPNGGYYSQEDVKDVVAYAAARNIMVIPEFEMPGHAKAALSVYPSLACVNKNYSKNEWGVFPDLFCAGKEEVYTFIRNVLDEIIGLFPGKYIHIGGDEAKKTVWEQCPHCQALMRKMNIRTENDLQGYFVSEIARYINAKGKMVLGWDEILESSNIPDMTVMSWRGVDGGIKAAQLGYDAIMSPYTYMYLDYYQSSERQFEPYAHGGCLPLEKVYGYEPRPSFLSPEQAGHIKGVQGNLWTEYIHSENNADYMLFPRLLAVSEVAWSSSSSKDYQDFLTRLKPHLRILDEHNVLFRIPEAKIWVDRAENGDEFLCLQAPVDGSSLVYSLESADLETYGISSGQETLKIEIKTSLKEVNYVVQLPSGRRSSTYTYKLNK